MVRQTQNNGGTEEQLAWSRRYLKQEKIRRGLLRAVVVIAALILVCGTCYIAAAQLGLLPAAPAQSDSAVPAAKPEQESGAESKLPEPPPERFAVHFSAQGAQKFPASFMAESGALIPEPADPVREGFVFEGWFRDESGSRRWDFGKDAVTKDTTLYARWSDAAAGKEPLPQTGVTTGAVFWCCALAASLALAGVCLALLRRSF